MSSYRIFRIFGISVELHVTFILFLFLLLFFMGFASFLFFLLVFFFVLAHELSHSVVAKRGGIPVNRIVLTFFGGIASVEIPENPKLELKMAVAGPLLNFAVVLVSMVMLNSLGVNILEYSEVFKPDVELTFEYFLLTVVYINLVLGLFNMVPGFPMDGGRILRSLLAMRMDYLEATRLAVGVGQFVVFPLLFILGVLTGNVFLLIIPVFLFFASANEVKVVGIKRAFRGMKIGDICVPQFPHVKGSLSVRDFFEAVEKPVQTHYVVSDDDGRVIGVLNVERLKDVKPDRFGTTRIVDFTSPNFKTIDDNSPVSSAMRELLSEDFLLIVRENKVVGYMTPELLLRAEAFYSIRRKVIF